MVRSMFSGVSGLRNHQIKMDVIGNNIANVNTLGFKASRSTFKEMYNQTLRSASSGSDSLGGVNAMQVGLGVSTGSIDMVFSTGGVQTTDRQLDVAIEGDGMFAVMQGMPAWDDGDGQSQLYFTRGGNFYLDANGYLITSGGMFVMGMNMFDFTAVDNPVNLVTEGIGDVTTVDDLPDVLENINQALAPGMNGLGEVPEFGRIMIPLDFTNISIGKNGLISGLDRSGELVDIAVIPLAGFVNTAGLDKVGENLYLESKNSGIPSFGRPTDGKVGDLKSGALEMSNVDLSREFTEMIITQRGFQANSRIITVSDTLLEELINLKR